MRPHRPRLLSAGLACLALGTAFPLIRRGTSWLRGLDPDRLDGLHGFLLGLALGLLVMALWRDRPASCPPASRS